MPNDGGKTKAQLLDEVHALRERVGILEGMASERLSVEEALRESEARLRCILDHSTALISTKDLDGNVTVVNRHFEVLAGPRPGEWVGKNVYDLFPSDVADALWQNDLAAREGPVEAEETVAHRDGALHTYLTVKFPLIDDIKGLFGTGAVSTDITERKQMEAERERLIVDLREALERIKTLKGVPPICMHCKKIRDDEGYWHQVEVYVRDHTEADFTHGLCAECMQDFYGEDAEGVPGQAAED